MLTYRDYVYTIMQEYHDAQVAVLTIPEQIETERLKRETLRAQKTDGDRVSGGSDNSDEAWLTSIQREEYLKNRLDQCRNTLDTIGMLFGNLDEEEQTIVSRLILNKSRNAVANLAEEWEVDERTVFRAKDRVLKKLARLLTGEARA